ncbi:MAG: hypothetical protein M1837_005312 [Sclerophora amabilis]|nr:MAG: hypothetical protein M1837_005312 [Sclerophora amabilis]
MGEKMGISDTVITNKPRDDHTRDKHDLAIEVVGRLEEMEDDHRAERARSHKDPVHILDGAEEPRMDHPGIRFGAGEERHHLAHGREVETCTYHGSHSSLDEEEEAIEHDSRGDVVENNLEGRVGHNLQEGSLHDHHRASVTDNGCGAVRPESALVLTKDAFKLE